MLGRIQIKNITSLSNLQKKVKVGKKKSYFNNTSLFARLASLFETKEMLSKPDKSSLGRYLKEVGNSVT